MNDLSPETLEIALKSDQLDPEDQRRIERLIELITAARPGAREETAEILRTVPEAGEVTEYRSRLDAVIAFLETRREH